MLLSNNTDFFQRAEKHLCEQPTCYGRSNVNEPSSSPQEHHRRIQSNRKISLLIDQTIEVLAKCGFDKMCAAMSQIRNDLARERFVVSVVGEFNHGKSTFLNRLLGNAAMLPVADLPTTAILTRIRYAKKPQMVVFDEKGTRQAVLDIKPESWNGLVANNFGKEDPKGCVIVGVANSWLGVNRIELIDSPGAGDLSEERSKVIGDVLNRSDGAIIAINATAALSRSEKLFINNRVLSRKIPFTLIIINKLDLVKKEERCRVVKYVKDVLALNKMMIPVYVPYDIEMPDSTYDDIIGMDKVMNAIVDWTSNPERQQLIERWVKTRVKEIIDIAINTLSEQEKLLNIEDNKRLAVIASKKQVLDKFELEWNDITLKLQAKSNDCYKLFIDKVNEYANEIAERLQFEASHAVNPEKWWKEDYPYRLKVELANLAVGLENIIYRIVSNDAKWINDVLSQKFHSTIFVGNIDITDKDEYKNNKSDRVLEFENLNKQQNYARIGTIVLSLALAPALGLLATMGVGTAGALLSSSVFKKKIEEQRILVKETVAKNVPAIVMQATSDSERRIQKIYDEMLEDLDKKKQAWLETQTIALENANPSQVQDRLSNIAANKAELTEILNKM